MEIAAVMVEFTIHHAVEDLLRIRVDSQTDRIGGETGDAIEIRGAAWCDVGDKKDAVGRKAGMKIHAQHSQFPIGWADIECYLVGDIEEGLLDWICRGNVDVGNQTAPLDDEKQV